MFATNVASLLTGASTSWPYDCTERAGVEERRNDDGGLHDSGVDSETSTVAGFHQRLPAIVMTSKEAEEIVEAASGAGLSLANGVPFDVLLTAGKLSFMTYMHTRRPASPPPEEKSGTEFSGSTAQTPTRIVSGESKLDVKVSTTPGLLELEEQQQQPQKHLIHQQSIQQQHLMEEQQQAMQQQAMQQQKQQQQSLQQQQVMQQQQQSMQQQHQQEQSMQQQLQQSIHQHQQRSIQQQSMQQQFTHGNIFLVPPIEDITSLDLSHEIELQSSSLTNADSGIDLEGQHLVDASVSRNQLKSGGRGEVTDVKYVVPFLYVTFSQPYTMLKVERTSQKVELSCYDVILKGPKPGHSFRGKLENSTNSSPILCACVMNIYVQC